MRVIIISIYICLNAFLYGNEKDSDDLLEQAKDIDKKIESLEGKPTVNDSDSENIEKVVSDEPSDHNQSEANIDNSSTEDNGSTNDKLRNELTEKVFEWNTVVLKLLPPITQQMMNVNLMFVDEDSFKSLALVEDIKEDADGKKQLLKKMSEKARNVLNLLPDFDLRKLSSEIYDKNRLISSFDKFEKCLFDGLDYSKLKSISIVRKNKNAIRIWSYAESKSRADAEFHLGDFLYSTIDSAKTLSFYAIKQEPKPFSQTERHSTSEPFLNYQVNRVTLEFEYKSISNPATSFKNHQSKLDTILLVDGNFVFALANAVEGCFSLESDSDELVAVSAKIKGEKLSRPLEVKEIAFLNDPRILIIPLYENPQRLIEEMGIHLFKVAEDPYALKNLIIVDNSGHDYGLVDFNLDLKDKPYIESYFSEIKVSSKEFIPQKGDFVFNEKSELMGIMINSRSAYQTKALGSNIASGSRTLLGSSFDPSKTNSLLKGYRSELSSIVKRFRSQ